MAVHVSNAVTTAPVRGKVPFTLTRAGTATRIGPTGLVESAAANVPRLEYDPVTLAVKGLLIEASKQNIILRSSEFDNATWRKLASGTGSVPVVTANDAIAPDGTLSADRVVFNTGAGTTSNDFSLLDQVSLSTSAGSYAGSFYIKGAAGQTLLFRHVAGGSVQTVVTNGAWQRISAVETSPGGSRSFEILLRQGIIGTINSSVTVHLWGAQLELGTRASSHIPTTSAAVTRNADDATISALSEFFNAAEGTIVVDALLDVAPQAGVTNAGLFSFNDGTTNEIIAAAVFNGTNRAELAVKDNNVLVANPTGTAVTIGQTFRFAAAYALNDFAQSLNGGAVATDNSGTLPTVNQLKLGNYSGQLLNGYLRRFRYYDKRLSNDQLRALSRGEGVREQPRLEFNFVDGTYAVQTGSLDLARIAYENLARDGTVSASSSATDFPATAPQYDDTFEAWRPTAVPATWRVDLGAVAAIDFVGVAAHTLGTDGGTLQVQFSDDDATWNDATDAVSPADDEALLFLFSPRAARYWRVRMTGAIAQLGVVYMGKALVMQRALYRDHSPITLSRETVVRPTVSERGQWLGRSVVRSGYVGAAAWRNLTAKWYRDNFDPFVREARDHPFFFAWRPSGYAAEVAYVWTNGDIRPVNSGPRDFVSVGFAMTGAASV